MCWGVLSQGTGESLAPRGCNCHLLGGVVLSAVVVAVGLSACALLGSPLGVSVQGPTKLLFNILRFYRVAKAVRHRG